MQYIFQPALRVLGRCVFRQAFGGLVISYHNSSYLISSRSDPIIVIKFPIEEAETSDRASVG